ncbi:hypothetical protein D3C73_1288510 [compost metagenome]
MIANPKPNNNSCRCQPNQPPAGCQLTIEPLKAASHNGIANNANRQPPRKKGRNANRNSGGIASALLRSRTCMKPLLCFTRRSHAAPGTIRVQSSGINNQTPLSQIKSARAVPTAIARQHWHPRHHRVISTRLK